MTTGAGRLARAYLSNPNGESLRHVLGHYPTGVAVITTMTEDGPTGMAMNSFTSVSLDPPLVLFCPANSSSTWPALRKHPRLAINVLSAQQEEVSRLFARKDVDRFAATGWSPGHNGAPLLNDALGWIECHVTSETAAGDHSVVVAQIDHLGVHDVVADALVFFKGAYHAGLDAAADAE
jgi:3-hydroxy-9,10-secoandrosta-1,3,5(10)-triene-9,17-dione monooxygenase reductase component